MLDEHKVIPKITTDFQQLLEGVLNGSIIVNREKLSEKITNFIDIQWAHLNVEEKKLFPVINKTLQKNDWVEIEAQIKEQRDPLFGSTVEVRYERLYEMLD